MHKLVRFVLRLAAVSFATIQALAQTDPLR
jgi:hypothetical protein